MKCLFYNFKESWMDNPRKTLLVVRFLGTTPTSSSIPTMLLSICQQICYNMEVLEYYLYRKKNPRVDRVA